MCMYTRLPYPNWTLATPRSTWGSKHQGILVLDQSIPKISSTFENKSPEAVHAYFRSSSHGMFFLSSYHMCVCVILWLHVGFFWYHSKMIRQTWLIHWLHVLNWFHWRISSDVFLAENSLRPPRKLAYNNNIIIEN